MPHRFIDTEIWSEDWFCEMKAEHQLFWNYITCKCDNAGIWKPNKIDFEVKSGTKISLDSFLKKVNENGGRERIIVIEGGRWFMTGFIAYQWFNKQETFDLAPERQKLHLHLYELLLKNKIPLQKVRGLREVLDTSKVKDRDKGMDENKKKESESFSNDPNQPLEIGTPNGHRMTLKAKYLHDVPKIIHNLEEYFLQSGQLEELQRAGWTDFKGFMTANPGRMFESEGEIYHSFKKYSQAKIKSNGNNLTGKKQQHTASIAKTVAETYSDVLAGGKDE